MLAMGDSALRKEADAMTFVGCDLHTRTQQVAVLVAWIRSNDKAELRQPTALIAYW